MMNKRKIPGRCVERLSIYRRALLQDRRLCGPSVFSHELAFACRLTAAQVRRDLMAIGYSGSPTTGYEVKRLLSSIGSLLDPPDVHEVAILGMGHLGRSIAAYLVNRTSKIRLSAAFDVSAEKVGGTFSGVPCYSVEKLAEVVAAKCIVLGILTVPAEHAQEAAESLVRVGIKGILNFAPTCLHIPEKIHVENIDMTVALEKVAFFACGSHRKKGNIDDHSSTNNIDQAAP
jgi:redox-sensing transcriptional repressor